MGLSFIPYLLAPYEQIYSACFFYFTCSRNYEQIFSYILYITFQQICQEEIFRAPICNFLPHLAANNNTAKRNEVSPAVQAASLAVMEGEQHRISLFSSVFFYSFSIKIFPRKFRIHHMSKSIMYRPDVSCPIY